MKFWCAGSFLDPPIVDVVARASEESGYHGVVVADHLLYPRKLSSPYPYTSDGSPPWEPTLPWLDPWVAIGSMAAVTSRLRFTTSIYIAPARHPLVVAKLVSSAAVLSGGRVALGAGIGWMREEYEAGGQDYHTRGKRLDEMIEILEALWTGETVDYHGRFYDVDGFSISPVPETRIPIYTGGDSEAALRRAARADGWIASQYDFDRALERLAAINKARSEAGTQERTDYEVLMAVQGQHDDLDLYRRLEDAGITGIMTTPWASVPGGQRTGPRVRDAIAEFGDRVVRPLDR